MDTSRNLDKERIAAHLARELAQVHAERLACRLAVAVAAEACDEDPDVERLLPLARSLIEQASVAGWTVNRERQETR